MSGGRIGSFVRLAVCLLAAAVSWPAGLSSARAATCTTAPDKTGVANSKLRLALDSPVVWQTRGGEIRFTITGIDLTKDPPPAVVACMRWKERDLAGPAPAQAANNASGPAGATQNRPGPAAWTQDMQIIPTRIGATADKSGTIFAVTVPYLEDRPAAVQASLFGAIPAAELRVIVSDTAASPTVQLDATHDIGITSKRFALCLAVLFVAAAAKILYCFASRIGVPGRDPVLRIISSSSGWASLAQFQIVLWTLVIGAGSVYVMTLTGGLIAISSGTLILLGIAGGAAVGSQIKSGQDKQPNPTLAPPGQVTNLGANGPTGDTWIRLSWQPPNGGGLPDAYCVQYRHNAAAPGPWINATIAVTKPSFTLVGLAATVAYDVQVSALNAGGSSTPLMVANVATTAAAPALPHGVPAQVTGLSRSGFPAARNIGLVWQPQAGVRYTVEYRAHDSDQIWQASHTNISTNSATVDRLRANTDYDFRVFASNNNGSGQYSEIVPVTTGTRIPRWSDIVSDTDQAPEIDVTRVQMLFFTVISAFFVAMTIGTSSTIPEIPDSYVTLMGISNGVYLTAKFTKSGRG